MQIKQAGERQQRPRTRPPLCRAARASDAGRAGRSRMIPAATTAKAAAAASPRQSRCAAQARTGERPKAHFGHKEVLRRALMPPPQRRLSLRWWNFRPTPSRLSAMSMD